MSFSDGGTFDGEDRGELRTLTDGKELVDESEKGASSAKAGLGSREAEPKEQVFWRGLGLNFFKMSPDSGDKLGASLQPDKTSCGSRIDYNSESWSLSNLVASYLTSRSNHLKTYDIAGIINPPHILFASNTVNTTSK